MNWTNSEHGVTPVLDRLELDIDADTLTGDHDVGDTVIGQLGPSGFAAESEVDVSDVCLDLAHAQAETVVVCVHGSVDTGVWRELKPVVGLKLDHVGEQVGTGKNKV